MTERDLPALLRALQWLNDGLAAEPLTADRLNFYAETLSDLPLADVMAAIQLAAKTCKFFPRPAEIRELCASQVTVDDAAENAWMRFRYALQRVSIYDSVDFGDPILHATIRAQFGGWPQCLEIQSNRMNFVHAEFVKLYTAFARTRNLSQEPLQGTLPRAEPVRIAAFARPSEIVALPASSEVDAEPRDGQTVPLSRALRSWLPPPTS